MNLHKVTIFVFCFFFWFNNVFIASANEDYDKCVKKMTEEAGGEMDYVYQAIIIQTCKAETEEKNNNDS